MAHPDSIVIVGGGLAGAKGAEGLREQGFRGGLTVIGSRGSAAVRATAAVEVLPAGQVEAG